MTHPAPASPPRRRRPRAGNAPFGPDIALALLLFVGEPVVALGRILGDGMAQWAAGERADAGQPAAIGWIEHLLLFAVVVVVLAAVLRAWWTVVLQLFAGMGLILLLTFTQHEYDRRHQAVPPPPVSGGQACHSGGGRCG